MDHLTSLPTELKLAIAKNLTDAADVFALRRVNRSFYRFVDANAYELARYHISTVELRGTMQRKGCGKLSLNLINRDNGVDRLWKFANYASLDATPIREWTSRCVFTPGVVQVRLLNTVISPKNCSTLIDFVKGALPKDFKKGQIEFKLSLVSCHFYKMTYIGLREFFNTFLDIGVRTLVIEDLQSDVFTDICHSLAQTDIHLVDTLRIQCSKGSRSFRTTSDLYTLLTAVSKPDRKMTQLIIDGEPIPLETISNFIAEFCNNPYSDPSVNPPHLRCFFSIDNTMHINDIKNLREMSQKSIQNRKRRASNSPSQSTSTPKRKKTQIYVEFGYYEEEMPLNQTLHAVIGLSVNEYSDVRRPFSN